MAEKNQGEGNREADRRYRQGVRETVRETSEEERAEHGVHPELSAAQDVRLHGVSDHHAFVGREAQLVTGRPHQLVIGRPIAGILA